MKQFTVHKTFLEGALKGVTIQEQTNVIFEAGRTYGGGWTGPRYRVTAVETNAAKPIPADQPPTHPLLTRHTTT